ncbi:MAG: hypothetical protein QM704_09565 [Anaeromyxobacteraceae bacterium]
MAKLDPRHAAWTVPLELDDAGARTADDGADVTPAGLARLLAQHVRAAAPDSAEWNHHEEVELELDEPALRPDPSQDDGAPKGWPPA